MQGLREFQARRTCEFTRPVQAEETVHYDKAPGVCRDFFTSRNSSNDKVYVVEDELKPII